MRHPFSRLFGVTEKAVVEDDGRLDQEELVDETKEEITSIPVDQIVPNRFQPRTIFDEEKLMSWQKQSIHMELFNQLLSG